VKRLFTVLLYRIMAKPELPALRQPRPSSGLLISKVSLYDVREKDVRVMTRTDPSALTGVAVSAGFVLRSRNSEYVMFAMSTV